MHPPSKRQQILRPNEIRRNNRAVVLRMLRQSGRLSRAEIARGSGLSEGTISRIVADLIADSLVVEDGAENSTGGRPGTCLQLAQDRFGIGVNIETWETRFSVANLRGRIVESKAVRTPPAPDRTLEVIAAQFRAYQAQYGADRLEGLGVTARGIVDSHSGVVKMGNDPRWRRVPVREPLQRKLGVRVDVENNARAAAVAEYHYTNPDLHNCRCVLFVMVTEGFGVGIILDGRLYTGPHMAAGEFGQMVVADVGDSEPHDRRGCLEQLVSNQAICARYAALTSDTAANTSGDSSARVRRICQAAINGDPQAHEALRETARYLGLGIANLMWGLDPDAVILWSTMDLVWPILLPLIQQQLPDLGHGPSFRSVQIRLSMLGEQCAAVGAATLPFSSLFNAGESARTPGAAVRPIERQDRRTHARSHRLSTGGSRP
ncbi:MAG: ROK family protein [Luteitalea sp.]|nr:ROK family protein [Luteitalea sp.]